MDFPRLGCRGAGAVRHARGEADAPMDPRSSLKPAQAAVMPGAAGELPLPGIALAAASHSAE
ncbi:asparaginase [Saccharopolyspora phatthalungensis]|uniref:asparaginase n=1 Tax=Saccharopolyspora phatthalungensis TaxID=664693 RepID=UPI001616F050